MKISKGKSKGPWVVCLYGVPGIGKSTLGACAPKPVFCDLENGLRELAVEKNEEPIKDWNQLRAFFIWAHDQKDYKTIVVDTLGAVEEILTARILADANATRPADAHVSSIEDKEVFPFGLGYTLLKSAWAMFMQMVFTVRDSGKNVLLIAHESIEKINNPEGDDYNRYSLNIQKKSLPYVVSKVDAVLFAQHERVYQTKGSRKIPVSTGRRILITEEKAHCLAKNRFKLPQVQPFSNPETELFKLLGQK